MQTARPVPVRYDLPPLARLETNWHPPWLIARLAQHGVMHYENGAPMDDSHIIGGTSGAIWMAAADGVGSQPLSRLGSAAACLALDQYLGSRLTNGAEPSRRLLVEAFAEAHDTVRTLATRDAQPLQSYSTTLAAVIIKGNTVIGATVGDSGIAIATQHENENGVPTFTLSSFCSSPQPPRGTYALADPAWTNYIATSESRSPHISTVIVATDGANNFFLHAGSSFRPDWPSVLEGRVRELGPLNFVNFLSYFIQYQPPENHDDRTLLIAYRPPADIAPPAAKPR